MRANPLSGNPISLRNLLPHAEFVGADDVSVSSCNGDWQSIHAGQLFVALQSALDDALSAATKAVARGAIAVLAARPMPEIKVPVCLVPNIHEAYGRLCQALAGDPCTQLKVIGVTGAYGKMSTACLVASILTRAEHRIGLLGTLGYCDGKQVVPASLAIPPADELARLLSRMVVNGCSHAVMALPNRGLDDSQIAGLVFDAACVTNLRRDYLDPSGSSMGGYRLARSRLLDHLAVDGFAVVNADDSTSIGHLSQIEHPALTIGIRSSAEITATIIEQLVSEQTFLLTAGSETIPVRTRMIGTPHVYNCLMAAAVGLTYNIDLATVVAGLEAVDYIPGRMQRIECGQPFSVFVDVARTPSTLANALRTLREVNYGRIICVLGAEGECDAGLRPQLGRVAEEGSDMVVLTNDNPRNEDPQAIFRDIRSDLPSVRHVGVIPDRARAIAYALGHARAGDCVLIAGKGNQTYQIIGQKRTSFDDCEVARQWLYTNQPDGVSAADPDR